jgi:uncharacterized membrane protein YphA (DoxX/SURF4 family)
MTTKAKSIAYWTTTILVALPIGSGGVGQIAQFWANPHGTVAVLGYPLYFFAILGFWKVLGSIAILVPRFPRLKEWAYAGIFFDLRVRPHPALRSAVMGLTVFMSSLHS